MTTKFKAVALCRVSSLEQLLNNSLSSQQDNVLKAAEFLNVTIPSDGVWAGHQSAKKGLNFNRKDLLQIYDYCRRNKAVKYVIVQEVDRFMRSPEEQAYWYVKFWYELKVKVWFADKPELNEDTHNASLFRFLEGWRAGGSNEERITKSINGGAKSIEQGRYVFGMKPGYMKGQMSGIPEIHPTRGPALQRTLIAMCERGVSPTQALKDLNASEYTLEGRKPIKMDKYRKIATDPFYAGILSVNKQVQVYNEYGLHQALISIKQHEKLLQIFNGKPKNQKGPASKGNPKFPLNNLVSCLKCNNKQGNRFVGMDLKNGKKYGKIYSKYRCRTCNRYISKDDLHSEVKSHLASFSLNDSARRNIMLALLDIWSGEEKQVVQDIKRMRSRITDLNDSIKKNVKAAVDPSNAAIKTDILSQIDEDKNEVVKQENKIEELEQLIIQDKTEFLDFAFDFLDNIEDRFFEVEMDKEKRVLCKDLLIPSGFYLSAENKVYTQEISPIYTLKVNKKDTVVSKKSLMVRVQGL